MLLAVLLVAFGASRSCASTKHAVSKEKAIATARTQLSFQPEQTQIRFVRRGIETRGYWAISFSTLDAEGQLEKVAVMLVDAETGAVSK